MSKIKLLKQILLEKLKLNPNRKLIQKLQQLVDEYYGEKIYLDNSIYMELIDELATQITEMNFGQETYQAVEGFTKEAQEYYNEMYDLITSLKYTLRYEKQ